MSTQLREVGELVEVSMVVSQGKRRKLPRKPVLVPRGDRAALREAAEKCAAEARVLFAVKGHEGVPVV